MYSKLCLPFLVAFLKMLTLKKSEKILFLFIFFKESFPTKKIKIGVIRRAPLSSEGLTLMKNRFFNQSNIAELGKNKQKNHVKLVNMDTWNTILRKDTNIYLNTWYCEGLQVYLKGTYNTHSTSSEILSTFTNKQILATLYYEYM